MRGRSVLAATALLLVLAAAPAHAQYLDPTPPWPQLLPAAPTGDRTQPGPVPGCETPSIACVEQALERLRAYRDRYGCDHRAVFAATYAIVTDEIRKTLLEDPAFFDDDAWLESVAALFADYYFRTLDAREAGEPVPEAWRIAFDTAERGDANAAQDMLLGINAHVQRDMPFVMAESGLRYPDGASRKHDHDVENRILARAYEPIVTEIARRYDPIVSLSNASWHPLDDVAGMEIVATWREGVWRNAERLVEAKSAQERAQIAAQIEANAAAWARTIADFPAQPGYREVRDAHCASALAAEQGAGANSGNERAAHMAVSRPCRRRFAWVSVRGSRIRSVRLRLDGRRAGKARNRGERWRGRLDLRGLRRGRHRVAARVTFADGSKRTLRTTVRRCR